MNQVHITLDRGAINKLVRSRSGPVFRQVEDVIRRTTNGAKARVKVDEGRLRSSIHGVVNVEGTLIRGRCGSNLHYAIYPELGTGIYGPRKRPIRPVHGRWLVFEPSGGAGPPRRGGKRPPKGKRGGLVFTPETKGMPRAPYLVPALEAASPWPIRKTIPH